MTGHAELIAFDELTQAKATYWNNLPAAFRVRSWALGHRCG